MSTSAMFLARHKYKLILVSGLGTSAAAMSVLYATSGKEEEDTESPTSSLISQEFISEAGEGIQVSEKVEKGTESTDINGDQADNTEGQVALADVLASIGGDANAGTVNDASEEDHEDVEEEDDKSDQDGLSQGACDPKNDQCSFYKFWKKWTIDKGDLTKWKEHLTKNVLKEVGSLSSMSETDRQQMSETFRKVWPKSIRPRDNRVRAFMYHCYRELKKPASYTSGQRDVVRDVGRWCLSTPAQITTKSSQSANADAQA